MIRSNERGVVPATPFATGAAVSGRQFIGRGEYLKRGRGRLKSGSSYAICGIKRIGKTSLARKLLYETENWQALGWITVEITLQDCQSFFEMWRRVARKVEEALSATRHGISPEVRDWLNAVEAGGDVYEKVHDAVESLFKRLMTEYVRTILLIDEFDYVVEVFGDDVETRRARMMFLRTLAEPKSGVTFVLTSRRRLDQLERSTCGGSTFHQSMLTEKLIGFDKREHDAFRGYMAENALYLDDAEWETLTNHAGRSPFMLSKAAEALFFAEDGLSVEEVLTDFEKEHIKYFQELLKSMREDGDCLKRMIQIFVGPQYDLTENGIDELKLYGYIWQKRGSRRYETISPLFEQYLKREVRDDSALNFWPLMTETEHKLRDVIALELQKHYGDDWETELRKEADQKELERKIDNTIFFIDLETIKRYKKNPGERLIDQCNFRTYYNIIAHYRKSLNLFVNFFDGRKLTELKKYCFKIHDLRGPFAHSNGHLCTTLEIKEADLACEKILEWLK